MADEQARPGAGASANGPPESGAARQVAPKPGPTQIILNPAARPLGASGPTSAKPPEEIKDSFREVVETIVFVVVLVLLLKTFLAEAFVIPTGSMATTLLGYHYSVTCAECSYHFEVNASTEADPQDSQVQYVYSCTCPNCGARNVIYQAAPARGGRAP